MPAPSPYDYLDYRAFLGAWFEHKKAANPRFSHRMFARMAGQKSPSLLHHVLDGKRNLTPQTVEAFAAAMKLRAGEARFFRHLVDLDQAKDEASRNEAWEQIAATRRFREARPVEKGAFEYLSNWSLPAIRELANRPDFVAEPAWVAEHLRPRIGVPEARRALDTLIELGMLVPSEDTLVPAEASIATPPEVSGLAFRNYHRGMLERATDAIETFPGDERHLLAVTVGVPRDLLPVLKEEANRFMQRMMHLCDASELDVEQVMQLNLQLFPMSSRHPADDPEAP